jgi:hypothetical protein
MLITKEIQHPLRLINLEIDDSKPLTKKENKLINTYVKLHDRFKSIKDIQSEMQENIIKHRNRLQEVFGLYEGCEQQIKTMVSDGENLLVKQDNYQTYKKKFDALMKYALNYNLAYHVFNEKFEKMIEELDSIQAIRNTCIDYYDADDDPLWKMYDELVTWLFENYKGLSVDIVAFDTDSQNFLTIRHKASQEFDKFYNDLKKYIIEEYNPFMTRYNSVMNEMKGFNDTLEKLRDGYLLYTQAEHLENRINWFDWMPVKFMAPDIDAVDFGISFDLEYDDKEMITLHLDTYMIIEDLLNMSLRESFKIKCTLQELFTNQVMEPLVGHCIDIMINEVKISEKEWPQKIDIEKIDGSYYVIENLTRMFVEGESSRIDKDKGDMYQSMLVIKKGGANNLGVPMITVMDQLLFTNKKFDTIKNRDILNNIVSIDQYLTLRYLLPKSDKSDISLNLRQYILLLMLLDCVCQLLVGDHDYEFIKGLDKVGVNAEIRRKFLKEAPLKYKESMEHFKEINSEVPFLKVARDWNRIFF